MESTINRDASDDDEHKHAHSRPKRADADPPAHQASSTPDGKSRTQAVGKHVVKRRATVFNPILSHFQEQTPEGNRTPQVHERPSASAAMIHGGEDNSDRDQEQQMRRGCEIEFGVKMEYGGIADTELERRPRHPERDGGEPTEKPKRCLLQVARHR
jgi:hypothetical protein